MSLLALTFHLRCTFGFLGHLSVFIWEMSQSLGMAAPGDCQPLARVVRSREAAVLGESVLLPVFPKTPSGIAADPWWELLCGASAFTVWLYAGA